MRTYVLALLVTLLSGCTFVQGFGQMDDKYCAAHPHASAYRC